MPPQNAQPAKSPSFEEALHELEKTVEAMENEQLPLEDLVANYESGAKLLQHCESILQSARERIELITLRSSDLAPSRSEGAPPSSFGQSSDSDESDNDIRLF